MDVIIPAAFPATDKTGFTVCEFFSDTGLFLTGTVSFVVVASLGAVLKYAESGSVKKTGGVSNESGVCGRTLPDSVSFFSTDFFA
ncbi:MAG TPA: hypothetical protein VK742_00895 [Candidatus Sulfotelmatobacter sp.]|nr:hypothetical protein [Candidatus Sulfotelmatobacter sp.]